LGPLHRDPSRPGFQGPSCQPRSRQCLYEGCGRRFRPCCARQAYCSPACRDAARYWSQDQAQQKYRASEQGKARRREQSRRYRKRCRPRAEAAENSVESVPNTGCEGHHLEPPEPGGEKIRCGRPGCYNRFVISPRSPRQRFCSTFCRRALRAAAAIQRRWQAGCADCPWRCLSDRLPPGSGP